LTTQRNTFNPRVTIIPSPGSIPSVNSKLRYADMSVTEGGVARNTTITNATWVKVFGYTGSGISTSALLNIEDKNNWQIRLVVDGQEVFGANGIRTTDLSSDNVYDLDDAGSPLSPNEGNFGLSLEEHDRFIWVCPSGFPVRFSTSLEWYVKRTAGAASKRIQAGLFILTKE